MSRWLRPSRSRCTGRSSCPAVRLLLSAAVAASFARLTAHRGVDYHHAKSGFWEQKATRCCTDPACCSAAVQQGAVWRVVHDFNESRLSFQWGSCLGQGRLATVWSVEV
jgi:hypothetical protein